MKKYDHKQSLRSFDHKAIEKKWQEYWKKNKTFTPDIKNAKKPFYNLMMFPYPSAEGLHVGNMYAFTGADIYGRFQRMQGYDVFEPIGLDGFGIHSENYAIKAGIHPNEHAKTSEKNFYRQLEMIGNSYDWTRTLETYDPDYYKWTQWLFIQMFKNGLAYRGDALVNWCPSCKTVLADEQVEAGKCERCGTEVEKRNMNSWYFKITDYADKLLTNIEKIDWPEKIKIAQRNWIGKSDGMIITFQKEGGGKIKVFTTRPDTLNAVTFLATSKFYEAGVKKKLGEFSGEYALDPLGGRKIPIWNTNYVAPDYGTGVVMGVPAHDDRDMEFAKEYDLDVVKKSPDKSLWEKGEEDGWGKKLTNYHLRDWLISRQRYWGPPIPMIFCESCNTVGDGYFKGKTLDKGNEPIQAYLKGSTLNAARQKTLKAATAGWWPVPEKDLPVELPDIADFKPKGDGTSPLSNAPDSWKTVACPKCGKPAQRELDVSDTFLDSSWYFLRYPSVDKNSKFQTLNSRQTLKTNVTNPKNLGFRNSDLEIPWSQAITAKWLPVNAYVGGAEHAVLHLLYTRFVTMALKDSGVINFEEPFPFFYSHGLLIKDGAKMSKSKGNVINPDEYIEKFGADALRMYLMFLGPFDQGGDFQDTGMEGMARFIKRVWKLISAENSTKVPSRKVQVKRNETVQKVTEDIKDFRFNTATASIMEYVNTLYEGNKEGKIAMEDAQTLTQLLAPFAPHMTEEVWQKVLAQKGSVHKSNWPIFDSKMLYKDIITLAIQVNGKLRGTISVPAEKAKDKTFVLEKAKGDPRLNKWLAAGTKKEIFVPGKLINFVVRDFYPA